jgi:aryl-alcohol dehydrogenase-like predicted oxidoreductase
VQYRKLAKTDMEVSCVCFGGWGIVGGFNWGRQEESDSLAALRAAYDAGVNFFDTAEMYGTGKSEQLIAKALSDVRDNIIITSKISPTHFMPEDFRGACERSLQNLQTDRIDLYLLHWPNHNIPVEDTLGVLEELKQEGKVRAGGVSNYGKIDLTDCLATSYTVCSNQLAYNLLFRAIEYEVLPLCVDKGVSVLTYCSLMQGLLTGKFASADQVPSDRARTRHFSRNRPHSRHGADGAENDTFDAIAEIRLIAEELGESMADVSLAWLLAQKGVTSVIVGARNADQARRNVRAAELKLPQTVIDRLSGVTQPLKENLGSNPDMWQTVSRMR